MLGGVRGCGFLVGWVLAGLGTWAWGFFGGAWCEGAALGWTFGFFLVGWYRTFLILESVPVSCDSFRAGLICFSEGGVGVEY